MLFDSHAHLNFQDFAADWQEVIDDCQKNKIWLNNVGSQLETSKRAVEIAGQYETGVWAAAGLHPIHVLGGDFHPEEFVEQDYRDLIKSSKKIVALGETGLDFYHSDKTIIRQKEVFIKHLNLAKEFGLPAILHSRNSQDGSKNAYEEILKILKQENFGRGVIHCFGGTAKQALEFLRLGFFVGFTGVVTFDKTGQTAEAIKNLPLDAILIETDCPYLAPEPHRGERNRPQYVEFVARKIAEIKGVEYDKIVKQTGENAIELFKLKR